MKYSVNISNGRTHDNFMLNLNGMIVILGQVWGLLSFRNTLREASVIYPKHLDQKKNYINKLIRETYSS